MAPGVSRARREIGDDSGAYCGSNLMYVLGDGAKDGAQVGIERGWIDP